MKHSIRDRHLVHFLRLDGYTQEQTARKLKRSLKFVQRWWNRSTVDREEGSGRPPKLTKSVLARMRAKLHASTPTSQRKLAAALGLSHRTIGRGIKRIGLYPYRPRKVISMTAEHRKQRLLFARCNRETDFRKILFVDESKFVAADVRNRQNLRIYRASRDQVPPIPKQPHPIKINGAAGISYFGKSSLFLFTENMTAALYKTILSSTYIPAGNRLLDDDWQLAQDNDSKHTSHLVTSFLASRGTRLLHWPAKSPDLNPIENLWSILKEKVSQNPPRSLAALEKKLKQEWKKIPLSLLEKLIDSLPRRLEAVIRAKGGPIAY